MNQTRFRHCVVLSVTLLCLASSLSRARTWTSKSEKSSVEASFVAILPGTAVLRRDNSGKQIRVPLAQLNVNDQKWVMAKTGWGRVWTSSDGREIIADFKSADGKTVTHERLDGRSVTTAISRFSPADRAYIESRAAKDAVGAINTRGEFAGKVVSIADGDTITVLYRQQQVKIRLKGIDAPEETQPFGEAAEKLLSTLALGKEVSVIVTGRDTYARVLGIVSVGELSVNDEILRTGMAWHS